MLREYFLLVADCYGEVNEVYVVWLVFMEFHDEFLNLHGVELYVMIREIIFDFG